MQVIDLEEYAREGKQPPTAEKYRIRIDKTTYEVDASALTGRQILSLAGRSPERFMLIERLHGGTTKRILPDEIVDFTTPGIERFTTLPLDQTEG